MNLTKKMQEAFNLMKMGHKIWEAWSRKKVKGHYYHNHNDINEILSDNDCLGSRKGDTRRIGCSDIHCSVMAGLTKRDLIIRKSVELYYEDGKCWQTFYYYTLK